MKDTFYLEIRGDGIPTEVFIKNIVAVIHAQPGVAVDRVVFRFGKDTNYESASIPIPLAFSPAEVITGAILAERVQVSVAPAGFKPEGYGPPEDDLQIDLEERIALEEQEAAEEQQDDNPSEEVERRETVITPDPVVLKLNQG